MQIEKKELDTGIRKKSHRQMGSDVSLLLSAYFPSQCSKELVSVSICGTFWPPQGTKVARGKSHPKNSHVWFPNWTLTVLPAPRFSPIMVTLVPPDSGPRLGDRPVTVGVCEQRCRDREW